ncbi:GlxA family transcriptional regulator [Kitasatospora nipponensis]|uniref:GlxA family transcriptional regulator n=1 Tax=Kitasatospora nipponensis TaxID=258049 RepID=A0ABP4GRC0_9ACTN
MQIAVAVVEGTFDSGLCAVLDVFGTANSLIGQREPGPVPFTVTTVGAGSQVRTGNGLLLATEPVAGLTQRPDLLLLPAVGLKSPDQIIEAVRSDANAWVPALAGEVHAAGADLAAACTGAFFLAESGVLDGRRATTSWWAGPAFRARYPEVRLDDSRTLVHDGAFTTAAAAFAHIDLALAVVHRHSPALADLVARYLLIGDRPSQAAFAAPTLLAQADPLVAAFERWARTHLADPPPLGAAARTLGVSERTLQRTTQSVIGMSPLDFLQEIRLDEATFLLRTTTMGPDAIAARVGYRNTSTLRTLVRRRRGTTLRALRQGGAAPEREQQD